MSIAELATDDTPRAAIQPRVVAGGLAGLTIVVAFGAINGGARQATMALIGTFAGVALYRASFGFTSAWRRFLVERRSVGLRAQLAMLALTIVVFFPLLAKGSLFGQSLTGFVNPVGVALCLGAFLFGVGMQLGGGCGSGTLYAVGGGASRMMITLAAFITGSLIATADPLGWTSWPDIGSYSLVETFGAPVAITAALSLIAATAMVALRIERTAHHSAEPLAPHFRFDIARGPWPLIAGALSLALVNIATLLTSGHPWGITSAFALWGAKLATLAGLNPGGWRWWQDDPALTRSVFADPTSIMNFGLMLGALMAAGISGKFAPSASIPARSTIAAIAGGLLMGVGARLATGCNIGAFFSGVASGSLHGFVWLIFAIPGNAIGVRLRPYFQMKG